MSEMKSHPLAELFPPLDENALQELAADIKANGLRQAIVTHEGQVLDGRNRLAACKIADVEPRFKEFTGDDPLGYVISLNLNRRHLDASQRAIVAARIATLKDGQRSDRVQGVPIGTASKMMNVSTRSVKRAREVIESGDQKMIADVEQGKTSVSAAALVVAHKVEPSLEPTARVPLSKDDKAELRGAIASIKMAGKRISQYGIAEIAAAITATVTAIERHL
jgi:hypothetical protein